ncbi:hypothetical protein K7X08_018795 [Anisodus acutangulus]|uniref:F-box domain-containing protein n=1 Tax=Anisodus acutangulus TaxID=402998 RepID=A0A9Q1R9V9_9SOLA|nr:hypothetical protein K7X08_018795 [Anisodus acutangulus]
MAYTDREFLGGAILRLLTLGGIALWIKYQGFFGKRLGSKKEKALAEVRDAKVDYSELPDDVLSSIVARLTATNLRRFECSFDNKVRFYFSFVPVLEHVIICLGGDTAIPYIFGEFVRDLPAQIKSLTVTACYSQVKNFPTETQIFRNLRMLALLLESTYDFDIVKVSPVLDACPLLRYLDLVQWGTFRQARGRGIRFPLSPTYYTELKEVIEQMFLSQYLISPYYNVCFGCDIWREGERISIQRQLLGQAISSNVVVIIQ